MAGAVIVEAARTPIGKSGGMLRGWRAETLAAWLFLRLLEGQAVQPKQVEEVYLGNAVGGGGNIARLAWLVAGNPVEVPAVTVDRQCGSGLEAIIQAARQVESGAASVVVAGGVESVSNAPLRAWKIDDVELAGEVSDGLAKHEGLRAERGNVQMQAAACEGGGQAGDEAGCGEADKGLFQRDGLRFFSRPPFSPAYLGDPDMGVAAEEVARRYAISRQEQDEWAVLSHRRALAAWDRGDLDGVVCPLPRIPSLERGRLLAEAATLSASRLVAGAAPGFGDPRFGWLTRDEGPRKLTPRLAARAPAAFVPGGTVTAANSCGIHDAAAGVLIVNEALARDLGYCSGLRFRGAAAVGVDPNVPGIGPVPAIRRLCEKTGVRLDEMDLFEVNEPFAAPLLACQRQLEIPAERLNVLGGALAYGHPFGATGAVLVCHLYAAMTRRQGRFGVVALGIAGGLGIAALFERVTW